ncbi:hypothetical protein A176_001623 [Myxococcus hansupus]|uniref:Uncharacterized protein n=1 Tax=Pseudomyxococcus hansupus TaxID=1297742 RepID=A0A0H4WMS4_9BACT|nr:hypothetical protein A176_001623 [Myxococcus hansupus]
MPSYEPTQSSCTHRWQAFEKALENKATYALTEAQLKALGSGKWSLLFRGGGKVVSKLVGAGEKVALSPENKGMHLRELAKPGEGDWDIGHGRNFKWDCNVPYYHEAHHVIPDATLRTALTKVFDGPVSVWVASKMLDAPYCVHHKDNMLILPLDARVGDVLQLPIHRETKQCSHTTYDEFILNKLVTLMQKVQEEILEEHDKDDDAPKTRDLARSIEREADALYSQVVAARREHKVVSLEEYGQKMLSTPPKGT